MYYQNYEDYMRAVLGYANNERNYTYDSYYPNSRSNDENVENLYPDIYRIVNPVVEDVCMHHVNKPITGDLVNSITEEVYKNVEKTTKTQVNVSVKTELKNGDVRNPRAKEEHISETRQRNFLLNDLIRILVIKRLLGNRPPVRPPFHGPGDNMPPYPGEPRPPFNPRIPIM